MKRFMAAVISVTAVSAMLLVPVAEAASACPPEVNQAKDMLTKKAGIAKSQDNVQAPRSLAGARQDNVQAPRGQENVQAPRGQENVQAPRGQENVQA
ncbi:MAG: hypothetical protein HYR86_01105, partial [Candidatus Rokubacteria bacterium]|nr:hypothetical protein [Candidatus Rokubacteria bacterium]